MRKVIGWSVWCNSCNKRLNKRKYLFFTNGFIGMKLNSVKCYKCGEDKVEIQYYSGIWNNLKN